MIAWDANFLALEILARIVMLFISTATIAVMKHNFMSLKEKNFALIASRNG